MSIMTSTVTETTIAKIETMGVEELLAYTKRQRGRVEIDFRGNLGSVHVKVTVPWGTSPAPQNVFETKCQSDHVGLRPLLVEAVLGCYQQAVAKATDTDLAEAISRYWKG